MMINSETPYKVSEIIRETWPNLYRKPLKENTMKKFLLFSKESCGPCRLVEKYFDSLDDQRINMIEKIDLEDATDDPIPEENLNLARLYGITATPVFVVTDKNGLKIEEHIGGVDIVKNLKQVFDKHAT